ncbi:MAG: DUF3307 domain-containing protein [Planctomycetota bacterium]
MGAELLPLWIVSLHLLGDFVLQWHSIAQAKLGDWRARTLHVVVYAAPFSALAMALGGAWQPWAFPLLVAVPHWLTDSVRWCPGHPWPLKPLLVDQALHLCALTIAAQVCYGGMS